MKIYPPYWRTKINGCASTAEILAAAEETTLEVARGIFLNEHPTAVSRTICLLDNTIEGQVGIDWLILHISPEFREEIDLFYREVYRQQKLLESSPLMRCCICGKLYMFVKGVEKVDAADSAKKLLSTNEWPEKVGFCLHCDGNLQDESDYKGLVWVGENNFSPAAEWYDPSEHL